uniref:ANK_REP_REGION domain-containing protein n=1 Tax=Anopheles melas TaxID=34690 RepID=A0A182UCL9_9DIPT
MDHTAIWSAVKAGDIDTLRDLILPGERVVSIRKQVDENGWTLLHHAAMSQNLELVKLVTEFFHPDPNVENNDGMTALALACQEQCPVGIIIFLMESINAFDGPSPLEYAVLQNRVDLAKAVIAYETKRKAFSSASLLYIVTIRTGDLEMLQCLLDAPESAGKAFVTEKNDDLTGLEDFAQNASYEVGKKVACFKLLFNLLHPIANEASRRYNVNEILTMALFSFVPVSLIPHFIETEQKWEKRAPIRSLYERLSHGFDLLALTVLCECGPVTVEREQLEPILEEMCPKQFQRFWYVQLEEMFLNAIKPELNESGPSQPKALQLLEDYAQFTRTITLGFLRTVLRDSVQGALCGPRSMPMYEWRPDQPSMLDMELYSSSYLRAIECMMTMYNQPADSIVEAVIARDDRHMRAILIFPLLRYCTTLLMRPDEVILVHLRNNRLLNWVVHLFGPWKAILRHVGKPVLEVFSLKRFARDVVREAVWQGVKGMRAAKSSFLDRLKSLDVPRELNDYLRYCDYSSTKYFLEHMDAATRWLQAFEHRTLPYPVRR